MKVYLVRHQAGNVIHEFVFAQVPSETQKVAVEKHCRQLYGVSHPKTPGEPYWTRVEERDVLGPDEVPVVPDQGLSVVNKATTEKISISGAGSVTPSGQ